MSMSRNALLVLLAFGVFLFGGCASLQGREPVQVIIAGVEPLQGEGLELRMLVKLRIQNPNDLPLDFNGVAVQMDVQGKLFATGVSDAAGSVPRFGETIINVPVSISVLRIAHQAIGALTNEYRGKLAYEMTGKLAGPAFNSLHFKSNGEFTLPTKIFESDK
jgi:LEA14-like dessication related protein